MLWYICFINFQRKGAFCFCLQVPPINILSWDANFPLLNQSGFSDGISLSGQWWCFWDSPVPVSCSAENSSVSLLPPKGDVIVYILTEWGSMLHVVSWGTRMSYSTSRALLEQTKGPSSPTFFWLHRPIRCCLWEAPTSETEAIAIPCFCHPSSRCLEIYCHEIWRFI